MIRTGFPFWKSCFFYCFSVGQPIEKGVIWGYNKKEKVLKSKKELENQL